MPVGNEKGFKQTRENLEKIATITCLYRHTLNRNYYGKRTDRLEAFSRLLNRLEVKG